MKRICVYAGSNLGNRPEYKNCAIQLGKILVQNKISLIYGGSKVGLMGELANQVLASSGEVIGITPKGLFPKEIIHENLTELIEVKDMHERKHKMGDLADGFIALPGGVGTYEELFEMLSWAQLKIHQKPIGILNTACFFDPLIDMIQRTIQEGFMQPANVQLLLIDKSPDHLIDQMKAYTPPDLGIKWRALER
ncbi:LOG family protein [Anaerosinus massiliensis]|uniref:LOG family protein n=1 Tax=Massilibacillus massiliensis TaxID=1806837 RepID=UPI000A4AB55C|nr:TIGR00730 family Rossman fold protein [Massilibacillus massiliensis]